MSQAAANEAITAYLIPTQAGARFALMSAATDPRRTVLSALLRGGSSRPMPLGMLGELAGIPDRKTLGAILFQLQRLGWLSGDVDPLTITREPLEEALPPLLAALSSKAQGVLSDDNGFCFASTGFARTDAERYAAFGAGLYPLWRLYREESQLASSDEPIAWGLVTGASELRLTVCPLHVGEHVFHMTLAGSLDMESPAFIRLAALLLRRYVGNC